MFGLFGFASSESSSLKKNKLGHFQTKNFNMFLSTVKPVYNDHPWDPEKVVVVQRWSLFRGSTSQRF